jgi:RNA recognition motif-containing protein
MCACFQGTPGGSEPEPSGEEETPTDTLWVGRIPVNLVGGDMASILNINANKNISSLFSQFGKVKHSTVRIKNGENKSWALITFEDVESATRAKQEVCRATPHQLHR